MHRWIRCSLLLGASCLVIPGLSRAIEARSLEVPANAAWTDTGIDVTAGETLHLQATGSARVAGARIWEWLMGALVERRVGPKGTYVWSRDRARRDAGRHFPLPTMADGPAPAFGLIGKLGADGTPFAVGERYDGIVSRSGRLWLGINDDEVADNRGSFHVSITPNAPSGPSSHEAPPGLDPAKHVGAPIPGARVLVLYVDGLRPDVLHEMAAAGFLPHFKQLFLDQGVEVPSALTVFPSNTLIANGSLFTGLFSDRTGIKSQNQFERTTLKPKGPLSEWFPEGLIPRPTTRALNLLDKYAPENTHAFLVKRGVPTLASRLGKAFRFTTLPIAPLNPPPQWFHRAINTLGPFGISARLPSRVDTVNAQYALADLLGEADARVMVVWFPMVDHTSHHSPRGQFGAARRDLALADRDLGRMVDRLREVGWDRTTYTILISDHGHMGGEKAVISPPGGAPEAHAAMRRSPSATPPGGGMNQRCNLPRDWAHRQLGLNVQLVGQEWTVPGVAPDRFVFFDHQGAGQAKLFLPSASYFTGAWRRNRLHELMQYEVRPRQVIDLLDSLASFHPPSWDGQGSRPVDLILVKLEAQQVLVHRDPENQAIIHWGLDDSGQERYRYEPLRHLTQDADGAFHHEAPHPGVDPFGYRQEEGSRSALGALGWLTATHAAQEWLEATHQTRYPDAVVAIAKFFAWQSPVQDLAEARDPDLLVTASPGWSFRSDDGQGTDHGYPLADSMRISLFISGPKVPHGVLPTPHRIVDVLPTILEMIQWPYDPEALDGRAIQGIYDVSP